MDFGLDGVCMMNLFCYVITSDAGGAPNYDPPFLTLAICKPKIRSTAERHDVVVAFTGSRESHEPHAVRWAGVVSEKLTFRQYWEDRRFAVKKPDATDKSDNIYSPRADGEGYVQVPNEFHDEHSMATDVGGKYVLVFDPIWRFAGANPVLPASFGFRILGTRLGHRRHILTPEKWRELRGWLNAQPQVGGRSRAAGGPRCSVPRKAAAKDIPQPSRKPKRC
jgi:hypothetical protein